MRLPDQGMAKDSVAFQGNLERDYWRSRSQAGGNVVIKWRQLEWLKFSTACSYIMYVLESYLNLQLYHLIVYETVNKQYFINPTVFENKRGILQLTSAA